MDSTKENTFGKSSTGGVEGNISDYFYNFDNEIYAHFLYYSEFESPPNPQTNTINTPTNLDVNQDTLSLFTFPEYLIDLTPANIALNAKLYRLNETNSNDNEWCSNLIVNGSCPEKLDFNSDSTFSDGKHEKFVKKDTTFSISWVDLDFMQWDSADGRYKVGLSEPNTLDSTDAYLFSGDTTDTYDSLIYIGVLDTVYNLPYTPVENLQYIDRAEWEQYDTTFLSNTVFHTLQKTFRFNISVLGPDSVMFRKNGDCDRDGEWDAAEIYSDYGSDWCPDSLETGAGSCSAASINEPCNCGSSINADWLSGANIDPNDDNWRDCGWDGICSDDPNYEGADFNGTEGNGVWDTNEGLEQNGKYDLGEYFVDRTNGVVDPAELFYDRVVDGEYGFGDSFEDRNCNDDWDIAETVDTGNGVWDDDEEYIDTNGNGSWDSGEPLYTMSEKPVNFLANYTTDYADSCHQEVYGKCVKGIDKLLASQESVTLFSHYDASGNAQFVTYDSLIITMPDSTTRSAIFADVDSIVTVFSNVKIESLPGTAADYHVTKTKWFEPYGITANPESGAIDTLRNYNYDYHIFKVAEDGKISKMIHPEYFNHYGYYDNFLELKKGLWEEAIAREEQYIYSFGGKIRSNEYFYKDTTIVTSVAEYRVEEKYEVQFCDGDGQKDGDCSVDNNGNPIEGNGDDESIAIPMRKILFTQNTNDTFNCLADQSVVSDYTDCSMDSALTDVYKVIRTKTITMVGNGVEFGTRNTVYLAKGLGIAIDKLEMRWTEPFWESHGNGWKEFSRLELKTLKSGSAGRVKSVFDPVHKISLDQFKDEEALEFDPYRYAPTYGIHRLRLPNEK
ncbi:MAG: hypothetical protein QGF36_06355 [Candidatus Marinimicrobia bacterium]|nr:hypothetical protein [Candidatus Neomarinimicrobiota bacterium]